MKKKPINSFKCVFPAKSANEGFARMLVAAFASQLDPKVNELADLKTAVSEAVTNSIVHAYRDETDADKKSITITASYYDDGCFSVTVKDSGRGIDDVEKAMEPLFTTASEEERSGMGFTVMESFTDRLYVRSKSGKGTTVRMVKYFKP